MRSSSRTGTYWVGPPCSEARVSHSRPCWTIWKAGRRWMSSSMTFPPCPRSSPSPRWNTPSRCWLANWDEGPSRRVPPPKAQVRPAGMGMPDRARGWACRQEERGLAFAGRGRRIRSLLNDGQRRRNPPRLERSAGGAEFNSLCRIQSQRLTCLNLLLFTNSQVFDLLIYCVLVDDRASRADLPAFFGGSCILFSFYLGLLCSGFRLFSFLLSRQSLPECCFSRIIFRLSFGSFSFLFGFSLSGSSSLLSLCRRFNLTFGFDFQKLFLQIRWLTSYPVNASFRVLRKDQAGSNDFGLAAVHLAG